MSHSEWQSRDRSVMWHPFTSHSLWSEEDFPIIERGEGFNLIDVDGRRYRDGISSLWCNVHGHQVPELDEAIRDQLGRIAHSTQLGMASPLPIELAERLIALAPAGLSRVFYSDSGSTAVEIALKMAYQFRRQNGEEGRNRFLTVKGAYHGDTVGSVSLGGIDLFHGAFKDLLFETLSLPAPYGWRRPEGSERSAYEAQCQERILQTIAAEAGRLVAVVLEPVMQGANGMIPQPEGFVRAIREACTEHDVFLICDEVATGFYRTGKRFACDHDEVTPDILCLAKGLTAGYLPLAATLATERIFEGFMGDPGEGRTFYHGHTYTGNNLACAVALKSLELMEAESFQETARALNAVLDERLPAFSEIPHVGDIRRRGLMVGMELVKAPGTTDPYDPALRMGRQVILAARERGVILRPLGDVVVLMPAPAMPVDIFSEILDVTAESIRAACGC